MNAEGFRTLIDYQFWARDKLLAAAEGLSDEELARPNGFTYQSILGIFAPWCAGSRSCTRGSAVRRLPRGQSRRPHRRRWRASRPPGPRWRRRLEAYFEGLSDADPEGARVQVGRDGKELVWSLWQYIINLASHSGQHRSEAAEALTMVGRSPGELDFSVYMRFLRDER